MAKKSKLFSSVVVLVSEDESKLMELVSAGNQKAFEKLFRVYKDKIMSYVMNMTRNKAASEEVVADIFMKVYKNRESYNNEYKFSTWIWTIARNTTLDYLKKKKDLHLEDIYSGGEEADNTMASDKVADESIGVEEAMMAQADMDIVKKCMDNLVDNQKEALSLRIFSELSYAEITVQVKSTEKAIKSLINRAKSNLIACVKDCMEKESSENQ